MQPVCMMFEESGSGRGSVLVVHNLVQRIDERLWQDMYSAVIQLFRLFYHLEQIGIILDPSLILSIFLHFISYSFLTLTLL